MNMRLHGSVGAGQVLAVQPETRLQAEQREVIRDRGGHGATTGMSASLSGLWHCGRSQRGATARPRQTRNDSPQPQRSRSLGLLNRKPSFSPSRTKSSSVPSMNARLFGSTTIRTPCVSNVWSPGSIWSTYSNLYAMPEQPLVRTPRRSATPFPRRARNSATRCAARSVIVTAIVVRPLRSGRRPGGLLQRRTGGVAGLVPVIGDSRFDRVFGQDRTVDLDRRQRQLFGDLRIADLHRLIERLALDPLGDQRARRDGRSASVGLEARVLDDAVLADTNLKLHHVAARRRPDHSGANRRVVAVERTDIARVLVVIHDFLTVRHRLPF